MRFLNDILAKAGLIVDGTSTLKSDVAVNGKLSIGTIYAGQGQYITANPGTGNFDFVNASGGGYAYRWIQNGGTAMVISTQNNLLLGTTTDAGFKADIYGSVRVGISGNTGNTYFTNEGRSYLKGMITTDNDLTFSGSATRYIWANSLLFNTNNALSNNSAARFTFTQQNPQANSGTGTVDLVSLLHLVNTGTSVSNARALVIDFNITSNTGVLTAIEAVQGRIKFGDLAGTGSRMVVADANGVLSTQAIYTGTVTGTGTTNYHSKWASSTGLTTSILYDDGSALAVGTNSPASNTLFNIVANSTRTKAIRLDSSWSYQTSWNMVNGVYVAEFNLGGTTKATSEGGPGSFQISLYNGSTSTYKYPITAFATGNIAVTNTSTIPTDSGQALQVTGAIKQTSVTSSLLKVDSSGVLVSAIAGTDYQAALGFTPYNSTNPNGYISSYTETDTLASVTGRGASTTTPISINSATLDHITLANRFHLIGGSNFHITNNAYYSGSFKYANSTDPASKLVIGGGGDLSFQYAAAGTIDTAISFNTVFIVGTTGIVTASSYVKSGGTSSQFLMADGSVSTNPGWLTSYTETDTLASITARGASTSSTISAANFQNAYQVLSLNNIKVPGLYNYDGGISGTQPLGTDWYNVRTIEIGSGSRYSQFVMPYSADRIFYRRQADAGWQSYVELLHSGNYNNYSPTLTGSGASGTWSINITGNANSLGGYAQDFQTVIGTGDYLIIRNQSSTKLSLASWASVQSGLGLGSMAYASTGSYVPVSGGVNMTGKLGIMNGSNGAGDKGIAMWQVSDTNWGIYMTQAGAGLSFSNGTASSSLDGRISHAIRFRVNNSSSNYFQWENASEQALMSLTADYGDLYTKRSIFSGGDLVTTNVVYPGYNNGSPGTQTSYYIYGNTANSGLRTNGNFLVNGDIYFGARGQWLSSWIDQNLSTGASVTHYRVDATNFGVGNAIYFGGGNNYFNWDGSRINSNVGIASGSDMRAPIFYDSNDTSYYVDPNGVSRIYRLQVIGDWAGGNPNEGAINIRGQYPSMTFRNTVSGNMWLRHMDGSGHIQHYFAPSGADANNWNIKHTMYTDGVFYSSKSHNAPIFYDSDDGSYYVDPNATSVLSSVNINANLWLRNTGSYDFIISNGTSLSTNTIRAYYTTSDELRFYAKNSSGASVTPKIMVGDGTTFYQLLTNTGTWGINITGNANNITQYTINQNLGTGNAPTFAGLSNSGGWYSYADDDRNPNSSNHYPTSSARSFRFSFIGAGYAGGTGNYGGLLQFNPWDGTSASTGDSSYQLAFINETGINASGNPGLRLRNGINSSWNGWQALLTSSNYSSYALPITGGTLTGNRPITFDTGGGGVHIQGDSGGWGTGYYFKGSDGNIKGGFGALGGGSSLSYLWIGVAYNNYWAKVTSSGIDVSSGYISTGNPWNTNNSAYFPNGITTAGNDNWIYGHTYIGNAPSNGSGHEFWSNGNQRSTGTITVPYIALNQTYGAYNHMTYGGYFGGGDWQSLTNAEGQLNVVQVNNISGGGYSNYPSGVYTYGGVLSWRTVNHSFQLYASHTGDLSYKTQWQNDNYSGWRRILDSSNYPYAAAMDQHVTSSASPRFSWLGINSAARTDGYRLSVNGSIHVNYNSVDYVNSLYLETGGQGVHVRGNNVTSYGSIHIEDTRNSWGGISFDSGAILMMNSNESGHYRHGYGWQYRWYNGTMYVSTGSYGGGSEYSVIHSGNISSQSVNYANYSNYTSPNYSGAVYTNPQQYFNNGIGVKVAMTGAWSVWSDTLWVNGYTGGDVKWMCALHFLRNSEPRFAISAQQHDSSSYGSYYEVITSYNIASQSVSYSSSSGAATRTSGQSGYPHPGTGMWAFYNWGGSNGGASAPSGSSYTIGIAVGSHPGDQSYGFQIARNMWNTGLWTRGYDSGFGSWVRLLDSSNYSEYAIARGGDVVDGIVQFRTNQGSYLGSLYSARLQAYNTDGGSAFMSFHRSGYYAVNMGLDADNVFRIGGWSASSNRLQLDMSGNLTVAGGFYESSDARLKTLIQDNCVINDIQSLKAKLYTKDGKVELGYYAQEAMEYLPTAVSTNPDGFYNLSYREIHTAKIASLEDRVKELEDKLKKYES